MLGRSFSPLSLRVGDQETSHGRKPEQLRKDNDSMAKRENKFKELMEYDQQAVFQELHEKSERHRRYMKRKQFASLDGPKSLIKETSPQTRRTKQKGRPRVTFNLDLNIIEGGKPEDEQN